MTGSAKGVLAPAVFTPDQNKHGVSFSVDNVTPQTTKFAVYISGRNSFPPYMIPERHFIPERGFHSDRKPEWTHSKINFTWTRFRLGVMWTDEDEFMAVECTRTGMKVIPESCYSPKVKLSKKARHGLYWDEIRSSKVTYYLNCPQERSYSRGL